MGVRLGVGDGAALCIVGGMSKLRLLFVTTFLFSTGALFAAEPAAPTADDQKEFAEICAKVDAGIMSLQVDNFFGLFEDGPGFTYAFNAKTYSYADIRELHVKSWAKLATADVHTKLVAVARPAPNLAVVTSTGHVDFVAKDGAKRSFTLALTMAMIKRADGWRALQVHESTLPDPVPTK